MDARARTNPFPGLRPFMQEEADLFFGRDRQSDELVRRLAGRRFLAVVGTSGSGKSSLVRAGLLPSLEGGLMAEAGAHWRIAILRPQDDPIGFLAWAMVETGVLAHLDLAQSAAEGVVETTLRRSGLGLVEATRLARLEPHENLLILVDQFEELFRFADLARLRGAGDEAPAFVKLLLEAARQTEVPVYVVITMRSDFLGDCARFRDLPEAISDSQYLIPRLTRDELQAVITGPIGVRVGRIAPSLVQRLLNDVGDDMDQLPVLQHALMRAWDHWERGDPEDRPIEPSDLEAIGGMAEALSRHADEAFGSLTTERNRKIAERLFKCLTERGSDNRELRRPTPLSHIAAIANADPAELIPVIDVFRAPGRSFLMPPHGLALKDDSVIDISHESLIRQWGRLRSWVEEEAESRATYLRLVEAARLRRAGKAGLWGEPDLTYARQWREREAPNATWAERYGPDFDDAVAFLRDSEAAHAAELEQQRRRDEAERLAKERELEQAKALAEAQRQRADEQATASIRQRRLSWGLFALLALAVGAALYGWWQQQTAQEQAQRAEKAAEKARIETIKRQISQANTEFVISPTRGLILVVEALNVSTREQVMCAQQITCVQSAAEVLVDSLSKTGGTPLIGHENRVVALSFRADGKLLATADRRVVNIWRVDQLRTPYVVLNSGIDTQAVSLSADGKLLATAGFSLVNLFRIDQPTTPLHSFVIGEMENMGDPTSVSFSGDDKLLLMASGAVTANLWRLDQLERPIAEWSIRSSPLGVKAASYISPHGVKAASFTSDGKFILTLDREGKVWQWRLDQLDEKFQPVLLHDLKGSVEAVFFSSHGKHLLVPESLQSAARLINLDDRHTEGKPVPNSGGATLLKIVDESIPAKERVATRAAAFSADGKFVAIADDAGTVRVWQDKKLFKELRGHEGPVYAISFSPDTKFIATAGYDETARLWRLDQPMAIADKKPWENWSTHLDELIQLARKTAGRNLTSEEWSSFFPDEAYHRTFPDLPALRIDRQD